MIKRNFYSLLILFLISKSHFFSQEPITYKLPNSYGFEKLEKDSISNSIILNDFWEKLALLKSNKNNKVTVFHIGDSHIQADYITHTVRTLLQKKFGNSGRGIIAPLKIAKTNEPFNYKTSSDAKWERQFCVSKNQNLPFGISGMSIQTSDSSGTIYIKTFNTDSLDYSFNSIKIYQNENTSFKIDIEDTINKNLWIRKNLNSNEYISKNLSNELSLKFRKDSLNDSKLNLSAFSLENNNPGILYHSSGINGAKYSDYLKSNLFFNHLKELSPDLIIISLGTNESFQRNLDTLIFYMQIDSLVTKIKETSPLTNILLTTPACTFKNKIENKEIALISQTIVKYSTKKNLAYWDLFNITDGKNSCYKWKKNLLLAHDKVHFNKNGYIFQGQLFVNSLINCYNLYVEHRP